MQDEAEKEVRLALNHITKLIDAGREEGHLTYHKVNDLIPQRFATIGWTPEWI